MALDPVLAGAVAVDEAQQLRGKARARGSADLRIDADLLGLEVDLRQGAIGQAGPDRARLDRRQVVGQDHVGASGIELRSQRRRVGRDQAEDRHDLRGDALSKCRGVGVGRADHLGGVGTEQVALDGGGKHHGPAPVVDRPAHRRDHDARRHLLAGTRHEVVVAQHLPIAQTGDAGDAEAGKQHQHDQAARATIGPAGHQAGILVVGRLVLGARGLARGHHERVDELAEPGVEGLAPDRRLAAEAGQVRDQVALVGLELRPRGHEAIEVEIRRRDLNRLGQREEPEQEDDHDPDHHQAHPALPASGPDGRGAPKASAREVRGPIRWVGSAPGDGRLVPAARRQGAGARSRPGIARHQSTPR